MLHQAIWCTSGGRSDENDEGTRELLAGGEPNKSSKASIPAVGHYRQNLFFMRHRHTHMQLKKVQGSLVHHYKTNS